AALSISAMSPGASDINHRSGLAFISAPSQADGMSILPGGRSIAPGGAETTFISLAPGKSSDMASNLASEHRRYCAGRRLATWPGPMHGPGTNYGLALLFVLAHSSA